MNTAPTKYEAGSWKEALHDVYYGVYVGGAHSFRVAGKSVMNVVWPFLHYTFGVAPPEEEKPIRHSLSEEDLGLKVIGVGYGRTGTYSLTLALEELGFPTLHTQHMYENEEIFSMWTEEIFLPSIDEKEATLGTPSLDLIASHGYQATTDLPMALYFEQVNEQYPDCKFILTTRENSEVWFKSWDIMTKSITQPTQYASFLTDVKRIGFYLRWLFSIVNRDDSYLTVQLPLPDQNKKASIAAYEEHNRRVREVIAPERLLEYNVREGWEPLCNFLEIKDCPTIPFPKTNSARSVQVQSIAAFVVPLTIVMFVLFYLFSFIFQRSTGSTIVRWANSKVGQLLDAIIAKITPPGEHKGRMHRKVPVKEY